jgi:hypothetical protein
MPYGVYDQWWVSGHYQNVPGSGKWSTAFYPGFGFTTPDAEAAYFTGFFTPNGQFQYKPPSAKTSQPFQNTQLQMQAPYTPTRTVFSAYLLQANDPLVHYMASDLNSVTGATAQWANTAWPNGDWRHVDDLQNQPLPSVPANPIGGRYQPWGRIAQMLSLNNVDTNQYNLAYRDPLTWGPDNWDFPTNLYPTVGWIGRVHRGTPWQTVDLKSTNILLYSTTIADTMKNVGTNTWANWTGDIQKDYYAGQFFDAAGSAPMQDRFLFDIFTTRFSDNAVRGTLPVNQTHLAAWSALFSGMVVMTNTTVQPLPTSRPTYLTTNINPAGIVDATLPFTQQPPIWQLVNGPFGINYTRANTNLFPNQAFTHVGDVLQTPALTENSPFLNWTDPSGLQQQFGISDELYEWLPQQMMGLVRLGEPRFVLYCYGQALRPAPGGEVLGGTYFQLITNYQVVAESAVRAVIRVDGANTAQPHAVVESYNVLPPN